MMFWDGHGWGWGGWLLMTFSMLAFWGLLIAAMAALLRGLRGSNGGGQGGAPAERAAEQILAERYARGEIEEDEYRHRLDVLRGGRGPAGLTAVGQGPPSTPIATLSGKGGGR